MMKPSKLSHESRVFILIMSSVLNELDNIRLPFGTDQIQCRRDTNIVGLGQLIKDNEDIKVFMADGIVDMMGLKAMDSNE